MKQEAPHGQPFDSHIKVRPIGLAHVRKGKRIPIGYDFNAPHPDNRLRDGLIIGGVTTAALFAGALIYMESTGFHF